MGRSVRKRTGDRRNTDVRSTSRGKTYNIAPSISLFLSLRPSVCLSVCLSLSLSLSLYVVLAAHEAITADRNFSVAFHQDWPLYANFWKSLTKTAEMCHGDLGHNLLDIDWSKKTLEQNLRSSTRRTIYHNSIFSLNSHKFQVSNYKKLNQRARIVTLCLHTLTFLLLTMRTIRCSETSGSD